MGIKGITKYFDLSIRDQVEASLMNGAGDSFFLFSGAPEFKSISDAVLGGNIESSGLCPLLFTTAFVDPDDRAMDGPLHSIGTRKVITGPSVAPANPRRIQVNAGALVTRRPGIGGTVSGTHSAEKWNFLKRLFYFAITSDDPLITTYFGENGSMYGNELSNPHAVAPEYKDVWGNFGRSFVYKSPLGLLAVALSSSGKPLSVKYYQGAVLQQVGPQLQAGVGQATSFSGTNGFSALFTDVKTFTSTESDSFVNAGSEEAEYMNAYLGAFFQEEDED